MVGFGGKAFCTKNDAAIRLRQTQVCQASQELVVFSQNMISSALV
jgi:hypothetical protein